MLVASSFSSGAIILILRYRVSSFFTSWWGQSPFGGVYRVSSFFIVGVCSLHSLACAGCLHSSLVACAVSIRWRVQGVFILRWWRYKCIVAASVLIHSRRVLSSSVRVKSCGSFSCRVVASCLLYAASTGCASFFSFQRDVR